MPDRVSIPAPELIKWEFQVEQQSFIVRYGTAGGGFFKQVVLQSGLSADLYPVKRLTKRSYDTAKRISTTLK